ncbi:uncharacterized protein PHACADRAFT_126290 [Phanerochaete carnosa HHB-10118-sp]|uniref:Multiple RNA-binding domain-containing protein 1 n=1 Tax=Phanerochaete carnosa (strain HHB-10118-sp) TaxID=650164 RepID=K5WQ41_PHACS|nr:uncharacterized protein PHACADRAFT_126290 [Phanerochaete carnosa HHB-10118-sp]EKM52462.1 hypothetical protein PHACADRAFT_126290 [Phanerochaete carnosa HHB-10118-sp]
MSRLIVKNLPAYLTQQQLREHFESKGGPGGALTDVKVVLKPDGTSRRFGFVGYKTEVEAEKATKWFDRTFIHSSRINVSVIEGAKDAPAPRPNKRSRLEGPPSEGKPVKDKVSKEKAKPSTKGRGRDNKDERLEEFMQVMQPRKGPSWKDVDTVPSADAQGVASTSKVRMQGRSAKEDEEPSDADVSGGEPASDVDWLKRHMKPSLTLSESADMVFDQSDTEMDQLSETPAKSSPEDEAKSTILRTGRLFLRNLAFTCTEDELLGLFQPFGEVSQTHIPLDSITKTSKGLGYVTFADPEKAVIAYETLDKMSFQGRLLHVLPAINRKGKVAVEEVGKKRTLKDEREAKKKAIAGKDFNWGMLYMNSDAVVSSVADRMNISKSDILNPESDNAAVKLALAETHVIQETKSFLETNGVVLSSLSGPRVARSDTTILVKNIPYGTSADQIRELFEAHGKLRRVLVPPAGTMAVVEFVHSDEARKAFKTVAYRRMGNSITYLEKGPVGMFVDSVPVANGSVTIASAAPVKIADTDAPSPNDPPPNAGSTLFVKNLAFSTASERFVAAFRHLPDFAFARVQTKPDPKKPGDAHARLSMGYGFVGFKTAEGARKGLKAMQGYVLDGHALVVKFAGRGAEEEKEDAGKVKSRTTKMIVKNVPFEATKKDIRDLFGAHGQLKSVRLPKKFDHRSRGFAFLEFITRHEAENAYAALRHTHLLGRHLVLEWAEEDSSVDIEELRKKAGVGFGGGKELPGKKRKLEMVDERGLVDDDM